MDWMFGDGLMGSNYFDIFGLIPSFNVDQKLLRQRYFALSKKFHPDFNVHLSDEQQAEMLNKTSEINKAYKVLQKQQSTVKYLLELNDYIQEVQKDHLSPDFLMEMMELNELIMDLEFEFNQVQYAQAKTELDNHLNQIDAHILSLENRHSEDLSKEEWLLLKENYFKSRYLLRIKEKMNTLAHPNEK